MDFVIDIPELPLACASILIQLRQLATGSKNAIKNLFAMFWRNSDAFWNQSYRSGYWNFLMSRDQRPRHYVVAGIVREYFPGKSSILDVGCGFSPALNLMKKEGLEYLGIDISQSAVNKCREIHPEENCMFSVMRFESAVFDHKFDVILMSEVLYYYPLWQVPNVVDQMLGLLSADGILVITMNRNPKAVFVWFILKQKARLVEAVTTSNSIGSKWTIGVFKRL